MTVGINHSSVDISPLWTPVNYHGDVYELSQRSQILYHTLNNESVVLDVDWDEQRYQAVFKNQFNRYTTIRVPQDEQITMRDVLLLHGVILERVEIEYARSQDPNTVLDAPLEYMEPCQLEIWAFSEHRNEQG